jgi:hypothetical protein
MKKNPPILEAGRGVVIVHLSPVSLVIVIVIIPRCCPSVIGGIGIGVRHWHWHLSSGIGTGIRCWHCHCLGVGVWSWHWHLSLVVQALVSVVGPLLVICHHPHPPCKQLLAAEVWVVCWFCGGVIQCKRYLDDLTRMNTTDVYFRVNEVLTKAEVAE